MFSRRLLIVAVIAVFSSTGQAPADWTATAPLPENFAFHQMVHAQGHLYHLGGLGAEGLGSGDKVFYAQVTGPGTIAPSVEGPALPALLFLHAAAAWDSKLYVLGGQTFDGGLVISGQVYFSQIGANGAPGVWQTTTPLPEPMFSHSAVVWNGRLYITGGWTDGGLSNRVYGAEIAPDGTLGP